MFVWVEPQQMQAQQRTSRKIKVLTSLLGSSLACAGFPFNFRKFAEIAYRKIDWRSRINDLNRLRVDRRESRAQCFVPPHNLAQTPRERVYIQASLQMDLVIIERRASLALGHE